MFWLPDVEPLGSKENEMKLRRAWRAGAAVALAGAALLPACGRRRKAEVNAIVPSFTVSRPKAPLGSAVEITYTWTVEPGAENIFLVYKDGWHSPESTPQTPTLERTWTKKDAVVSFKNPKKDIVVYLEADTNYKAFDQPPVLTMAVAGKSGVTVPIANSEVFLEKVRVKAQDLGNDEWVDLRLAMNQSFVPKLKGVNS